MTEEVGLTTGHVADSEQAATKAKEKLALILAVSITATFIVIILYQPVGQLITQVMSSIAQVLPMV